MSTYGKKLMASLFIIIACVLGFIGHAAFLAPEKRKPKQTMMQRFIFHWTDILKPAIIFATQLLLVTLPFAQLIAMVLKQTEKNR